MQRELAVEAPPSAPQAGAWPPVAAPARLACGEDSCELAPGQPGFCGGGDLLRPPLCYPLGSSCRTAPGGKPAQTPCLGSFLKRASWLAPLGSISPHGPSSLEGLSPPRLIPARRNRTPCNLPGVLLPITCEQMLRGSLPGVPGREGGASSVRLSAFLWEEEIHFTSLRDSTKLWDEG